MQKIRLFFEKNEALPIFKLNNRKIRKFQRVVPEKKFRQTDKERNGQAHKQVNRQIDERTNRKKIVKRTKVQTVGVYFIKPSLRVPINLIQLSFFFVPGSLGSLCNMLLSLLGGNFCCNFAVFCTVS